MRSMSERRLYVRKMRTIAVVTCLGVACVAGCGGANSTYTASSTRACLQGNPSLTITKDQGVDLIADKAPGGKIVADFPATRNSVTLAFGNSGNDAKRMLASLKVFAEALDTPIKDTAGVKGNVLYSFENTPSAADKQAVADCLS